MRPALVFSKSGFSRKKRSSSDAAKDGWRPSFSHRQLVVSLREGRQPTGAGHGRPISATLQRGTGKRARPRERGVSQAMAFKRARPALGGKKPGVGRGGGKSFQALPVVFSKKPFSPAADDLAARVLRPVWRCSSFARPWAARRIILGPRHNKYGNVYLLARRSSSPRSLFGKDDPVGTFFVANQCPPKARHSREGAKKRQTIRLSYLLKGALS